MIIEFESKGASKAPRLHGEIAVKRSKDKRTSFAVIGSEDARSRILKKLT